MLKDNLYSIESLEATEGNISAQLILEHDHPIFKGHFPGQAVLPGACMLQIVKEIFAGVLNQPIRLQKASNLKFLSLIDPGVNKKLNVTVTHTMESDAWQVTGSINIVNTPAFKLRALFVRDGK